MFECVPFNDDILSLKTATGQENEPIMWAYAYQIGDVLIDAGCGNAAHELERYLSQTSIRRALVTHPHEDHFGGLSVLGDETIVYAHPSAIDRLLNPPKLDEFFKFVWGQPEPVREVQPIPERISVGEYTLEVVDLSGHHSNMIGFLERTKGWLFSADAVPLPSRKYIAMPEEDILQMITTMERIQRLDIGVLFDGHLGPIISPHEHIQKRIDHLRSVRGRVMDLREQGKSVSEIIAEMGYEPPWYLEATKGRFSIEFFIESLLRSK